MTDWNTFFQTDEFKAYRKKQAEQVGMFIENQMRQMINGMSATETMATMNGAMAMAKLLIDLPEKMVKDNGVLTNLQKQKKEDIAALASFLVRRQMISG